MHGLARFSEMSHELLPTERLMKIALNIKYKIFSCET